MTTGWIQIGPLSTSRTSIAGRVLDGETHLPLSGVRVTISGSPRVTATAGDGTFHFADLLAGEYELSFDLPGAGLRYGTATQAVTVEQGGRAVVSVELPPTGVRGKVSSPFGEPVYPLVKALGSSEEVYGDADGTFCLLAIEPGHRRLLVTANGCAPRVVSADVERGAVFEVEQVVELEERSGQLIVGESFTGTGRQP